MNGVMPLVISMMMERFGLLVTVVLFGVIYQRCMSSPSKPMDYYKLFSRIRQKSRIEKGKNNAKRGKK